MWKQILKARKLSRVELLNSQRKRENEDKIVLSITHHRSLAELKVITTRIHLLLTPDNEQNKVFRDVRIIGIRRAKNYPCEGKLKTKVGAALVKDLDVKFVNILYPLEILHHLLRNTHMRLDQKI